MKKLMLLGGARYLIPVIKKAHELGIYVITCDYLPDNIAHKYSDEYCNVSIVDKEKVLIVAQEKNIDGIMSFATDPGVVTAAYVAEQMDLPFAGSYEAVSILQNKDQFRNFLKENNFNVPESAGYYNKEEAINDITRFRFPIIVKPVDSAGSKGVTRVDSIDQLEAAINYALKYSLSHRFIIEEFIEKKGFSSDSDGFSIDGEFCFASFSDQRFDEKSKNPYTPAAYSWPSTMDDDQQEILKQELQRLATLLELKTSIYNIETRVGQDGKPYIMELSPRGGGNRLSEMLCYCTGTDLIKSAILTSVGLPCDHNMSDKYDGYWAEIILHSEKKGIFDQLVVDDAISDNVVEVDLWVEHGMPVDDFEGANNAIGTLILRFANRNDMENVMKDITRYVKVKSV